MQKALSRLERRFGRYAPQGLILWLVGLTGALHLLVFARPDLLDWLWLSPPAVLHGEVWRAVTFLFAPAGPLAPQSLLWLVFTLLFMNTMGQALEAQWGAFRFDLFYFTGAVATLVVGMLLGGATGRFLASALLLAFATEFPEYQILLLVLPVKARWLGWLSAALMAMALYGGGLAERASVLVAAGTYLLFCGDTLLASLRGRARTRARAEGAQRFVPAAPKPRVCARCGRASTDDPSLEFRVCDCQDRCHGKLTEYCLEHARSH